MCQVQNHVNTTNLKCFGQGKLVKPSLHIVVTIAEQAYDHVLKRVLKLSAYRLQIFLVKYEYLRSLQLCEDQGILLKLKNVFASMYLRSLRLMWRPGYRVKILTKFLLWQSCKLQRKFENVQLGQSNKTHSS